MSSRQCGFGTSFGGALHPPETHMWAGMPYYVHEDVSDARVAQRLVGYRFFVPDPIRWRESIHMRFGTTNAPLSTMQPRQLALVPFLPN